MTRWGALVMVGLMVVAAEAAVPRPARAQPEPAASADAGPEPSSPEAHLPLGDDVAAAAEETASDAVGPEEDAEAERVASGSDAPTPPTNPNPIPDAALGPEPQPEPDVFAPVLMMSIGVGTFIAGLAVHLFGIADRRAVEEAPVGTSWSEVEGQYQRAPALIGVGELLMGAGLVIVAGGTAWLGFALWESDDPPEASAVLRLEAGPLGARLRGRF